MLLPVFVAVAVILSDEGAKALSMEKSATIDFVRDAFDHLKAIGVDKGGRVLLKTAKVEEDAGVVDVRDKNTFISVGKTRRWDREKSVRTLAWQPISQNTKGHRYRWPFTPSRAGFLTTGACIGKDRTLASAGRIGAQALFYCFLQFLQFYRFEDGLSKPGSPYLFCQGLPDVSCMK